MTIIITGCGDLLDSMIRSRLVVWFQKSGNSSAREGVVVLTNGGFGRSLKASVFRYSSGNQRLYEDCTRIAAPLMDLHPFTPLSASQTFSHYFQQLLSSRRPERHDRKSVYVLFIYFFFIRSTVCHFLMFTRLAGWRFLQEAERCLYANGPERCSVALANSRRHLRKSHSLCSSEVRKQKQCCQSDSVGMMNRCLLLLSDTNTRDEMEINQSLQLDKTVCPAWVVKDVVVESAHVCCLRLPISCGGGGRKAGILYLTTPL